MRYHEYPSDVVAQEDFLCEISSRDATLKTIGGIYDWSLMPLVPDSSISDSEREMIGRLVYDAGVSSRMSYGYYGSGTIAYYTQKSLKDLFHYKQAVYAEQFNNKTGVMEQLNNTLLANFDAGYPVMMGISGKDLSSRQNVGHEIVGDGYGYVGDTLYVHLNLGWSGDWDAWYNLPNIDTYSGRTGVDFNLFDDIVYNIFPEDDMEIVSGRVFSADDAPIYGATVKAFDSGNNVIATATTSETGVYALKIPANRTVELKAELDGLDGDKIIVTTGKSQTYTTYFGETHASTFALSVGNRWGNDLAIEAGTCATPVFSRKSCSFVDELRIDCSQPDDKATIRYTADGSDPVATSPEWPTGGLTLRSTTILKARTFRNGMAESAAARVAFTDHPQPTISNRTITWQKPAGASYYKVFKSANRFGTELEECTGWISDTSYAADIPQSVEDAVFYFVRAASRPDDAFASPLSDAIASITPNDPETDAKTQVMSYVGMSGGTNTTFLVSDFPATVQAVYYDTSGSFGGNGFFRVNVPTTGKKNISLPENAEGGVIKTTKIFSSNRFGEANGTLFMGENSSSTKPRTWRASLYFEQSGTTNYTGASSISPSPVCFHYFQQCAPFVELQQTEISVSGVATNSSFGVTCPREHEWSAFSDSQWITLLRTKGRGPCPVRFLVESNPNAQSRTATITVICGSDRKTLAVTQGEHEEEPAVPSDMQIVATQGTKTSSVFLHWTRIEDALFYEIFRSAEPDEIPDVPYWTSSNSIPALIDVGAKPGMVYYYRVVAVTNEGRTAPSPSASGWAATSVSAEKRNVAFDATGGVVRVVIASNAGWSATSDADWLTLEAIDTERNGVLDVYAEANLQSEERIAKITLAGGEGTMKPTSDEIFIVQSFASIEEAAPGLRDNNGDLADAEKAASAEEVQIVDPTAHVVLKISDGVVCVSWASELPDEEQEKRVYTLWGRETLDAASCWQKLDEVDGFSRSAMRFFKVSAALK